VSVQDYPLSRTAAVAPPSLRAPYAAAKRAVDLAIAIPALVFVAPLLLVLAALIKLDSKGQVFFRQKRVGFGGAAFDIFKFRTMHVLENGDSIAQASKNDARVTRIGRILRRSSLDELPQLFNVLKGEMSLVGPRPHASAHDTHYAKLIANYRLRHAAKPGLTGWAQIHGLRGETPTVELMRTRVEHDVWYAQHASLALDLRILLRTPREVVRSRSAW
jgi:putative colanic acid biosynthesis UDP-glucose lipid carrier transferase